LSAALRYTGRPLVTDAAALGIASLQLAFSDHATPAVLLCWDATARDAAWLNLFLDFP